MKRSTALILAAVAFVAGGAVMFLLSGLPLRILTQMETGSQPVRIVCAKRALAQWSTIDDDPKQDFEVVRTRRRFVPEDAMLVDSEKTFDELKRRRLRRPIKPGEILMSNHLSDRDSIVSF